MEIVVNWSEEVWIKDEAGFKLEGAPATRVDHVNETTPTTLIWNNVEQTKDGNEIYIAKGTVQNYLRVENLEQTLKRRLDWKSSSIINYLTVESTDPSNGSTVIDAMRHGIYVNFEKPIKYLDEDKILLIADGEPVEIKSSISYNQLKIIPQVKLDDDTEYTVVVGADAVVCADSPGVKLKSAYEFSFTQQKIPARPFVTDVTLVSLGGVASGTIGNGSTGKVTITANNVGDYWSWGVEIHRRSQSIGSSGARPVVVEVNESKKMIYITLGLGFVWHFNDAHNDSRNAEKIAAEINKATDLFTAAATKTGRITQGDNVRLSGSEILDYERGRMNPGWTVIKRLCEVFDVEPGDLFWRKGEREQLQEARETQNSVHSEHEITFTFKDGLELGWKI